MRACEFKMIYGVGYLYLAEQPRAFEHRTDAFSS
jgi:hypothetical protein